MKFTISEVKPETHKERVASHIEHMQELIGTRAPLEAVSRPPKGREIVQMPGTHQFVGAVGLAFARHYPLVLSPDSVWTTISQGLAHHINKFAEQVRHRFVAHEGKAKIVVVRNGFIKGAQDNDWEGVFGEFSEKIKEHIGPANHAMIVSDFSTTGVVERAASEVVLMDAMQSYFEYWMSTMCGIPAVELTGTVEDWEKLRAKVNGWVFPGEADLSWWVEPLKNVLNDFILAAKGKIDRAWWQSFFKENEGHGSGDQSKISGWVNWLFPYIKSYRDGLIRNPKVAVAGLEYGDGLEIRDYPSSLSKVPFTWNYYGQMIPMELLAGVSATVQDQDTHAVAPHIGWAVREVEAAAPAKKRRR